MKKNVQSITFTNYGYLDFTLNLLASIKKNNIDIENINTNDWDKLWNQSKKIYK